MIGFNHALTGGLIARYLPLPLALPIAFISHFLLDMLPHYGIDQRKRDKSKFWKTFFIIDSFATLALAIYAVWDKHYAMFFGGLLAVCPDFFWVITVIRKRTFAHLSKNGNKFMKFHSSIQFYERPWGLWLEIPYAIIMFYVVMIWSW